MRYLAIVLGLLVVMGCKEEGDVAVIEQVSCQKVQDSAEMHMNRIQNLEEQLRRERREARLYKEVIDFSQSLKKIHDKCSDNSSDPSESEECYSEYLSANLLESYEFHNPEDLFTQKEMDAFKNLMIKHSIDHEDRIKFLEEDVKNSKKLKPEQREYFSEQIEELKDQKIENLFGVNKFIRGYLLLKNNLDRSKKFNGATLGSLDEESEEYKDLKKSMEPQSKESPNGDNIPKTINS